MTEEMAEISLDVRGHLEGIWVGFPGHDDSDPHVLFQTLHEAVLAKRAAKSALEDLLIIFRTA